MKVLLAIVFLVINITLLSQPSLIYPKDGLVTDSTSIYFSWNSVENASTYHLQISSDDSFSNLLVDQPSVLNTFYQLGSITMNERYYWRVSDDNSSNWSVVRSFRVVDLSSWSQVELWLCADSVEISSGSSVSTWYDLSGNTNNYLQPTTANQPEHLPSSLTFNGRPSISFDPSGPAFFEPRDFSYLSEGEVITLMAVNSAPATSASTSGLWSFGTSTSQDHYPYSNNTVYMGFGRATRFTVGNISSSVDLTLPHILNVHSGFLFNFDINEDNYFNSSGSSVTFSSTVYLGRSRSSHYMNGEMAEFMLFNEVIDDSIRQLAHQYLRNKYFPLVDLGADLDVYGFCDTTLYASDYFETYLWSDGSTADSLIVSQPGTYWIEATDIFGYVSRDTIVVELARPDIPQSNFYCPSDSITWYTNLGSDYNYLWSDGSTADSLSIDSPGDYHVEITDTNGCVFQSDTLTFGPDPFESIVTLGPDQSLCSGNTLVLQDGDSLAVDYLWNTSSTDSAIVLNNSGTYYVDVVNANGCEASDTIDITIIGDAPVVTIGAPATVCEGEEFTFEDFSNTTDGSTINGWNWDLGDGTVINVDDSSHVYNNDTTYEVSLTVSTTAGCSNTTYQQINVIPKPEMTFVSNNECQYSLIQFNGGQLSPTTISSWEWNFDDPGSGVDNTATGQNVSHVFDLPNDFDVALVGTDINGCRDTVVQTVSVLPSPQVDFDFNEVCEGEVVNFFNQTTINSPGVISSYNWSFGDGTFSGQSDPSRPYVSSGNYTINLVATSSNGCSGQLSKNLKIHAIPMVDRTVESSCAGLNTVFFDNSFVPDGSVAEVLWSIENGAPLNGFSVTEVFEESGTVEVEQTVNSAFGCTNSSTFNITIGDYIEAGFEFFPNALIAGAPTDFMSTSTGADFYEWTFQGIGTSVLPDTTVIFSDNLIGQNVEIELAVENGDGCRDSVAVNLPVLERTTDLQVDELFLQDDNGFYIVGVRLTNLGTTPINKVNLLLQSPGTAILKEDWDGILLGGETTVYVFESSPTSTVPLADTAKNYVCTRGEIVEPSLFTESNLMNNEVCNIIEPTQSVVIAPQPNPVNKQYEIKVVLSSGEIGTLKVFDAQGRAVDIIFEDTELSKGLNTYQVDATDYANGNYTLRYVGDSGTQQVKIVKQ